MARLKPCQVEGCSLPKHRPAHSCIWHWLLRQPIEVQIAEMRERSRSIPEDRQVARVPEYLWPPGCRWCASCSTFVPRFYARGSQCNACASVAAHGSRIRREYDLTPEQYDALFELQDRRCAICRRQPKSQRLAVDHDHRTGRVRGLCCSKCNHELLGAAHDSLELLENAVSYIKEPPASGTWSPPKGEVKRPLPREVEAVLGSIPYHLTAEDGYRLSGSRGAEVIYILRSALETPF